MKLKLKWRKWKDMNVEELEKEKREGRLFMVLGLLGSLYFLVLSLLRGLNIENQIFIPLMLILALMGLMHNITIDFEIRFKRLEKKINERS